MQDCEDDAGGNRVDTEQPGTGMSGCNPFARALE
jgi:hypothetical protein